MYSVNTRNYICDGSALSVTVMLVTIANFRKYMCVAILIAF